MFPDYQSLVMQHYEKKRKENSLSLRLKHPTTAKLRDECFETFSKKRLSKDRKILAGFFEVDEDDEAILKKIKKYETDNFKPLLNYLNGITKNTDPKNIELLAWLTGFEPRPFELGKNYALNVSDTVSTNQETFLNTENKGEKEKQLEDVEKNVLPKVEVIEAPQMPAPTVADNPVVHVDKVVDKAPIAFQPSPQVKQRNNQKTTIAILVAVMLVGIFIYIKNGEKGPGIVMGSTFSKEGGCMYWAGDHYEQIPCSRKVGDDTLVIALDAERLNSLKKITREDTITRNDIGKVWYIKINGKIEYYTASGNYPLDIKRRLKPLTDYIISTYITKR